MIVRIKTLQDKDFDIWKDEIEFNVANRREASRLAENWVCYFHRKGLDVKIEIESLEVRERPCTQL